MKNILLATFLILSFTAFSQTEKPKAGISEVSSLDTPVKPTIPPLLVLDGIVSHFKEYSAFENKLKDINPENIESIDVLKDKMAVEKYGEQGLHGVIVVRMKKVGSKRN